MSELLDFLLQNVEGFRRARLPSLYSDFTTQKVANPDGFAANQSAWIRGLIKASRAGLLPSPGGACDRLCINAGEDLVRALETAELGRPLALSAVIDQALKERLLVPYDEFLTSKSSFYARSWIVQPRWLLSWLLEHVGAIDGWGPRRSVPNGTFVSISSLEDVGRSVLTGLGGNLGRLERIIPMEMFKQKVVQAMNLQAVLSSPDTSVLLKYLARDKGAIKYSDKLVVVRDASDSSEKISPEEITIASLKSSIAQLDIQVKALADAISNLSGKAKDAVSQNNRNLATVFLRSRKMKEKTLAGRTESLTRLEEILDSIEQAADQVTMIGMMRESTKVLQALQREVGDTERVQDVVDQLKEETQKVEEVGSVMQDATANPNVQDDEVEEELAAMLEQAKAQADQERLENLNVPHEPPTTSDQAVSSTKISEEPRDEALTAS